MVWITETVILCVIIWEINLLQGLEKPFKTVIDVSSGNLHSAGIKPLTFVRQVIFDP